MKTYYDLTIDQRKKYLIEFKKTPIGKDIYIKRLIMDFVGSILLICIFLTGFLTDDYDFIGGIVLISLVDAYHIYFNLNFTAWLKNKHDIKRWQNSNIYDIYNYVLIFLQ